MAAPAVIGRYHPILSALLRLTAFLILFCLLLIGLSILLGNRISAPIIAFTRSQNISPYQFKSSLYIMDIRSTVPVKISDQPIACCVFWSPDGTRIAFTGSSSLPFVWDMRDNTTRSLAEPGFISNVTDWSPDSQSILMELCARPGQALTELLCYVRSDGTEMKFLNITDLESYRSLPQSADWSRDNQWIVYAAIEIYRIAPDGITPQQLTHFDGYGFGAQISPDGKLISFIIERDNQTELFLMDVDGRNLEQLTFTAEDEGIAVWSPDGAQLLYQTVYGGSVKINVINVETKVNTKFIYYGIKGQPYHPPSWSPDGRFILFEVQTGPGSLLYMIDANGENLRLLAEENNIPTLNASWQPPP